jgi:hypothetical protein
MTTTARRIGVTAMPSDAVEPPFNCQACDWRGHDPAGHEHQYHDGAQTCWTDAERAIGPPFDSDEVVALRAALAEAVSLLAAVDSDANNVQLDIARWRRRHHRVVGDG